MNPSRPDRTPHPSCHGHAAPPRDGRGDFDFLIGDWEVHHRRLVRRLAGCTEWQSFGGRSRLVKVLGGQGTVDDNEIDLPGGAYRALTVRSFDPASGQWAIWWLDQRWPHRIDVPMIGRFSDGIGRFHADDAFEGRPIRVRFLWTDTASGSPHWEQAFSADGGQTWETNWQMRFVRAVG